MSDSKRLFELNLELDKWLADTRKAADEVKARHDPFEQFKRWRNSQEGKDWKHRQYVSQKGCCAICGHPMPLKGSHIDHIKPISLFPDLALCVENLRLTCPICNCSKGKKEIS